MTRIELPASALVVLVGTSASGKSTFARGHFLPTEILSSDRCRAWVSDDEDDQGATNDAFAVLHHVARCRLRRRLVTAIDATNVEQVHRVELVEMARAHRVPAVAIVLDLPVETCVRRHAARPDRAFDPQVIRDQRATLEENLAHIGEEGFDGVWVLSSPAEIESTVVARRPRGG